MSRGKYIVFEGLDGSGKSTQASRLARFLGDKAIFVREPGSTPMAESIRGLITDHNLPRGPIANIFLFAAARADLAGSVIRPALASGRHVVSDRSWLSSAAYQTAEGCDIKTIISVNRLALDDLFYSDLLIFLDSPPQVCRERIRARGDSQDYFGCKPTEFINMLSEAYKAPLKDYPGAVIIPASRSEEAVWQDVKAAVQEHLAAAEGAGK